MATDEVDLDEPELMVLHKDFARIMTTQTSSSTSHDDAATEPGRR